MGRSQWAVLSMLSIYSYGLTTRPGQCPEQQLIAQRPSMINEARDPLSGEIPGILNILCSL